jgi:hypothetical protein
MPSSSSATRVASFSEKAALIPAIIPALPFGIAFPFQQLLDEPLFSKFVAENSCTSIARFNCCAAFVITPTPLIPL